LGAVFMKQAIAGLAAAALCVATGPAAAAEFPPKPETIKQIILGTVGDVVVLKRDPRASTRTVTTSISTPGFATSTSDTFDNPPERPDQVLRIINRSIYDLKDITLDCVYVAETGTPVGGAKSHTFLLVFPASSRRDVLLPEAPTLRYARGLACAVTDFEYIGIGIPPTLDTGGRTEDPSIANGRAKPVVDEWGHGSGRKAVY
jgi:hypothetical protein